MIWGILTCLAFKELENLETLTALTQLWVGKNKIVEMKVWH